MSLISNLAKSAHLLYRSARLFTRKNASTIMTVGAVATAGAAIYTGYKAAPQVEEYMDEVEERKEKGEHVSRFEVLKRVGGLLCVPVLLFGTSASLAFGANHIMIKRVNALATSLAVANQKYQDVKQRLEKENPELANRMFDPVQYEKVESIDNETGEVTVSTKPRVENYTTLGFRFDKSPLWNSDDNYLNMKIVEDIAYALSNKMYSSKGPTSGYVLETDVWGMFKLSKEDFPYRLHSDNGWSDADFFDLHLQTIEVTNPDGTTENVDWVTFASAPRYLTATIDYNAMYESYNY